MLTRLRIKYMIGYACRNPEFATGGRFLRRNGIEVCVEDDPYVTICAHTCAEIITLPSSFSQNSYASFKDAFDAVLAGATFNIS